MAGLFCFQSGPVFSLKSTEPPLLRRFDLSQGGKVKEERTMPKDFCQQPQPQLLFVKLLSQPQEQQFVGAQLLPNTQEMIKRRMIHEQLLPPNRLLHI